MGYWAVMAIVAIAVVAVLIATGMGEETPEPRKRDETNRPIWVAIGTNGKSPGEQEDTTHPSWVDLVRQSLGDQAITYDFTRSGCTVEEAQRDQLAAAVATTPDVVAIALGPDDFRDAEDLGAFERRLWHILTTLQAAEAASIVPALPNLSTLPSLAAEEDQSSLAEELRSWNVAIARLAAAANAELVIREIDEKDSAEDLFTEQGGRYILTGTGQQWFASLMERPVKHLLGIPEEIGPPSMPETELSVRESPSETD